MLILIIQSANKLKLSKTQTSQVSIFHLSEFFFWTRNDNWTNSLIAMQAPFVRHIIPELEHAKHEDLYLQKTKFSTKFGSSAS